jgi:hypothetical protein
VEEMSIGEFARRSRLSPKALRVYDGLGLLSPARVDELSGYRYYAALSSSAVTSRRPSGLEHRLVAVPPGTVGQGIQVLAGGRVPQPRRAVAADGGEQASVRAERHPGDPSDARQYLDTPPHDQSRASFALAHLAHLAPRWHCALLSR